VTDGVTADPSTADAAGAVAAGPAPRQPDLVMARVHLRLGSLGLARAELETLAGRDLLDDDAIRDLAEARWRTGDLAGAGEAAAAYLETQPDDILALVIAAEAQADLGRPTEARRLAGQALDRASGSLDPLFAGMPRSQIWPIDPGAAAMPAGVLFDDLHPGPLPTAATGNGAVAGPAGEDEPEVHAPLDPGVPAVIVGGRSLWGDDEPMLAAASLDPTSLFHSGRVALEAGQIQEAATALILALRASPGFAPAILDLLAGRGEPLLVLVRGDAQRIVGREAEALRDHAAAASGLRAGEVTTEVTTEPPVGDDFVEGEPATPSEPATDHPSQEDS
jgi:tetratricopeptide (TPR) repeat protein